MAQRTGRMAAALAAMIGLAGPAAAQSNPLDLETILQTWRDACSDPSPDRALGYLREAVNTGNIDVRKACLRQVLTSDNPDLLNAALRIMVTSLPVVRFRTGEAEKHSNNRIQHMVDSIRGGLVFYASNGNPDAGTATWQPIIDLPERTEEATGTVTVFGKDIHWVGRASYYGGIYPCVLQATLVDGSTLSGTFTCETATQVPVTLDLFD